MRLRNGVTVEQAIEALGGIIRESLQPRNIGVPDLRVKLNGYLRWVYGAQVRRVIEAAIWQ
jgi:hypothetical protein